MVQWNEELARTIPYHSHIQSGWYSPQTKRSVIQVSSYVLRRKIPWPDTPSSAETADLISLVITRKSKGLSHSQPECRENAKVYAKYSDTVLRRSLGSLHENNNSRQFQQIQTEWWHSTLRSILSSCYAGISKHTLKAAILQDAPV